VLVPEFSGGGAEKVATLVAKILLKNGRLRNLVAHRPPDWLPMGKIFRLPSHRWIPCLGAVARWSKKNPGGIRWLNLNYVLFAPWLRLLQPRTRILARPGNTISEEIKFIPFWKKPLVWLAYQCAFLSVDVIVAQSQTMAKELKKTFRGINSKIRILSNPVVPASIISKKIHPIQKIPCAPFIFCAMSFKPQKDFQTLVRGYNNFSTFTRGSAPLLVIAGRFQGEDLRKMVRQELGACSNQVRLVGELRNPNPWIRRSRFCVLSSHYEGNSNFLLEAVYHKRIIVATDCPGANREMAECFPGIFLSRQKDPGSLARQMLKAYRRPMLFRTGPNKNNYREFSRQLLDILKES